MKKLLLLPIVGIFAISTLKAQDYIVYKSEGNVMFRDNNKMQHLTANQRIKKETVIRIAENSYLTLIDSTESKRYNLTSPGTFTVEKLIRQNNTTVTELTKRYLSYLLKQMGNKNRKNWEDNYATVTRELDSIFKSQQDSIEAKRDSLDTE